MKIDRILALTDLSENSEPGLAWAGALAERFGGRVVGGYVLTRVDVLAGFTGGERDNALKLVESMRTHDAVVLEDLLAKHVSEARRAGVELVENPSVRDGIAELVERVGPDLVCMASHGRTGLKHAVLGSVAEHTLRSAGVPALVVRHAAPPPPDQPLRVLVGLDFSEGSAELAQEVAGLLSPRDELILAHVVESIYWSPGIYGTPLSLPQPDVPPLEEVSYEQLREIPFPEGGPQVSYRVGVGHPREELVALQKETGAHVTVARSHGLRGFDRLLLGSVAESLTRRCGGAVLVVPKSA